MFNLMPWKKGNEKNVPQYKGDFDNLIDRFFVSDFFPATESFFDRSWVPSIDVSEGKKEITVKAELPGIEINDIDVSLEGRVLSIKGEKKHEKTDKDKNYHRVERSYGYFSRSVELPADVDPEKVDASYKKGILNVVLKKTRESDHRKIEIKSV